MVRVFMCGGQGGGISEIELILRLMGNGGSKPPPYAMPFERSEN